MAMQVTEIRILLVEDNPMDAELIGTWLGNAPHPHFVIDHVTNLAEALERLSAQAHDVVLVDLDLPDSSGIDTVVQVERRIPETPLIVLTATDDDSLAMEAIQAGAQDYLVKGQGDANLYGCDCGNR